MCCTASSSFRSRQNLSLIWEGGREGGGKEKGGREGGGEGKGGRGRGGEGERGRDFTIANNQDSPQSQGTLD